MIGIARRRIPLLVEPYDAEVEYLQGDGLAYINLGIPCSSLSHYDTDFEIKFSIPDTNTYVFGGYRISNQQFVIYQSSFRFDWAGSYNSSNRLTYDDPYTVIQSNGELSCNNVTVTNIRTTNPNDYWHYTNDDFYLFCQGSNNIDVGTRFKGKIYYFTVKERGTNNVIANYIPVRIGQVGYLYDTVSGQLFGNIAGSGAFILGPDKAS